MDIFHEYGKNFSSWVAAHAPPKYQSNSTFGRGARASYRTMLPEISARRSLLEPSFRYLSPGREGERERKKCRPLDHTRQIPFVHSARSLIGSNSYIYSSILVICGTFKCILRWCLFDDCPCALAEIVLFFRAIVSPVFFPYGKRWCILSQNT